MYHIGQFLMCDRSRHPVVVISIDTNLATGPESIIYLVSMREYKGDYACVSYMNNTRPAIMNIYQKLYEIGMERSTSKVSQNQIITDSLKSSILNDFAIRGQSIKIDTLNFLNVTANSSIKENISYPNITQNFIKQAIGFVTLNSKVTNNTSDNVKFLKEIYDKHNLKDILNKTNSVNMAYILNELANGDGDVFNVLDKVIINTLISVEEFTADVTVIGETIFP